ncbi:MAG: hypothetical protein ABIK13_02845 [Patescibacteria group bacterium]
MIGGKLEVRWFALLERAVRLQGGSCEAIRHVFLNPKKVARLASYVLSLASEETIATVLTTDLP